MKRICIVRQSYYPVQKNLRRDAETLVAEGHHVDVICLRRMVGKRRGSAGGTGVSRDHVPVPGSSTSERKRESIRGVNVHRISLTYHRDRVFWYLFDYAAFFLLVSLKLAWLSIKKRYDVIEVDTMPDFLVFVTLFPRMLGSKVILYMFENTPWLFITSFNLSPNHIGARVMRFIETISASYAHQVIVSDGLPYKKVLESRGIPSDKITVVLNVPDDAIFDIGRVKPNEDGGAFRLIVVSSLLRRYGVQTLVKALPLIRDRIPNVTVDIIGDGEYRPVLEQMARDLGVEQDVNFAGWVRHDDIPSYIARAHVGVAPMIHDVGAPNKIFEYFALGKPALASAQPGLTEMFGDDHVQYFRPGDEKDLAAQALAVYENPERRASLGSNGLGVYRNCQWSVMRNEYLGVYQRVLG